MARLQDLRRAKPLTQRELATAAGVSEATIRVIEGGRAKSVRPRTMRAIAAALAVKPADINEFAPSLQQGGSRSAASFPTATQMAPLRSRKPTTS